MADKTLGSLRVVSQLYSPYPSNGDNHSSCLTDCSLIYSCFEFQQNLMIKLKAVVAYTACQLGFKDWSHIFHFSKIKKKIIQWGNTLMYTTDVIGFITISVCHFPSSLQFNSLSPWFNQGMFSLSIYMWPTQFFSLGTTFEGSCVEPHPQDLPVLDHLMYLSQLSSQL